MPHKNVSCENVFCVFSTTFIHSVSPTWQQHFASNSISQHHITAIQFLLFGDSVLPVTAFHITISQQQQQSFATPTI